jgi:hypothetical protein
MGHCAREAGPQPGFRWSQKPRYENGHEKLSISSDIKYRRWLKRLPTSRHRKTLARARQAVELAVAKHDIEQHVSPEIAQARDATRKALKEAEQGWQRAIDKIAERASLTKGPDTRR